MADKYGIDTVYLQDGSKLTFDLETVIIPPPVSTDDMNIEEWNVSAVKSGKVIMMRVNIIGDITGYDRWYRLGDLPAKIHPLGTIFRPYITQAGNIYVLFQIHANGIYIHNFSKHVSGNIFFDTITYICA